MNHAQVVVAVGVSWIKMDRQLVVHLGGVPLLFLGIQHAQVEIEVRIPESPSKKRAKPRLELKESPCFRALLANLSSFRCKWRQPS